MRMRRMKVEGADAVYHCMTRTVNGELLFEDRDKEVLRKMLWQLADFCGVEILTYCVLSNHFHVLVRVRHGQMISNSELKRRYKVLYPRPTKYQAASAEEMFKTLEAGGEDAASIRRQLLARMGDVSEFMKSVKQRFSVWYNRTHQRYGTLWAERFKSVLVEGHGNPLQTMAAYIDLNPVRAGLVENPKDYRFCGYAEAVAGAQKAVSGLIHIWCDHGVKELDAALKSHRLLIFGKYASDAHVSEAEHASALKILNQDQGCLPKTTILRCRVRYFTDGAILGSTEFVKSYSSSWQMQRRRKYPPTVNPLMGSEWGDLAVIQGLRKKVFG